MTKSLRSTGGQISTVTNIRGAGVGADITWVWGAKRGGEEPGATCETVYAMWGWEASEPPGWYSSPKSYWLPWGCGVARRISSVIRGDGSAGRPTVAAVASWNITSKCHHLLRSKKSRCSISSDNTYLIYKAEMIYLFVLPWPWLISKLMHKILIYLHIIHLLKSSICFKHYPAHLQEVYVVIVYMQPLVSSLSAGDCLVHRLRKKTIPEAAYIQLRRRPPKDEQNNARNM